MGELASMCGHLLRRAQQVHNALWAREVGADPTSPQYAVLAVLESTPGIDQRRTAELASLDTSSTTEIVARLERTHWVARQRHPDDGRRYTLRTMPVADAALDRLRPRVQRVQDELLAPLAADRRADLLADLAALARLDPGTPPSSPLRIPGHLLRRAQQVHTALFAAEFDGGLTGPQYAVLHVVAAEPDLGQSTVGERAALDRSTIADIVERLVARGWIERRRDPADGRRRILRLTTAGAAEATAAGPRVLALQERVQEPVAPDRRADFLAALRTIAFAS